MKDVIFRIIEDTGILDIIERDDEQIKLIGQDLIRKMREIEYIGRISRNKQREETTDHFLILYKANGQQNDDPQTVCIAIQVKTEHLSCRPGSSDEKISVLCPNEERKQKIQVYIIRMQCSATSLPQ